LITLWESEGISDHRELRRSTEGIPGNNQELEGGLAKKGEGSRKWGERINSGNFEWNPPFTCMGVNWKKNLPGDERRLRDKEQKKRNQRQSKEESTMKKKGDVGKLIQDLRYQKRLEGVRRLYRTKILWRGTEWPKAPTKINRADQ